MIAIPQVPGKAIIGSLNDYNHNNIEFCENNWRRYGDIFGWKILGASFYLVNDVTVISEIIRNDVDIYTKGPVAGRLKPLLGNGLLLSSGDLWRRQRKISQPAFHMKCINRLLSGIISIVDDEMERWEKSGYISLYNDVSKLTFKVVASTILGSSNVKDMADTTTKCLTECLEEFPNRLVNVFSPPLFFPTKTNRRINKNLSELDRVVRAIIEQRRTLNNKPDDLLTSLIDASEDGFRMTTRQLRDELMTLMLAGFDTTASLITWTIINLCLNPVWSESLYDEVRNIDINDEISISNLTKLPTLNMILLESLRLYPPAWMFVRTPTKTVEINGYRFTKGSNIMIAPYLLHRSEKYWENPEIFKPERMSKENIRQYPKYAFLPFSGGQRICIGSNFALTEARITLCKIIKRFDFTINKIVPIKPMARITIKPSKEIRLRMLSRKNEGRKANDTYAS